MPVETEHRFTVNQYYRLGEIGLLSPRQPVELLQGKIIPMSPIGPYHGGVINRLIRLYAEAARGRWQASAQNPLRLDDYSEPQPDFILLRPSPDDYTHHHPVPADVLLLIEVSDSTLEYDREEKLPAYGRAGVTEVWIINLPAGVLEVYREPHFTGYAVKIVLSPGEQAIPQACPGAAIPVADLLKR